jgi:hypothetical protein
VLTEPQRDAFEIRVGEDETEGALSVSVVSPLAGGAR